MPVDSRRCRGDLVVALFTAGVLPIRPCAAGEAVD